jgi:dTDP-4-dehydrorhamnose reductase
MTVQVVGAGGMLGQAVMRAAGAGAVGFPHAELDVTDAAAVSDALRGADAVINCAAYTDVDGAESEVEAARAVNVEGARNVARAAARVVYVSTDYVFDGAKADAYVESDAPGPLQEYGRSKLEGERATLEANANALVVRTSWLFGAGGRNFVETMLRLAQERKELRVVDDQTGSPTFTGHLAGSLCELATGGRTGVLHVVAAGSCSWFDFARAILDGEDADVRPCASEDFPRPARRPANSVLASERGAPDLPHWREGLGAYLGVRA